jgi:thiol-disulfide isomerase/thioredoxin
MSNTPQNPPAHPASPSRALLLGLVMLVSAAAGARAAQPADSSSAPKPAPATPAVVPGRYRAVLKSPGGELPFGLDLKRQGAGWVGYLINGKERVKLTDVTVAGPRIDIKMPGYENQLTAVADGGQLRGEIVLDKLGGKDQHLELRAQLAQPYRFFPAGKAATADVSGRWAVTFTEDDGKSETAVGEFSQSGDSVTGTFLAATGDHRFLEGQVHDGELYLSTFDGAHVFLYKAKIGADASLAGDYWSGTSYHERWTANRDARAALPDAYSLTSMRGGGKTFDFEFPDLGGRPVSSKDPKFHNKVLIVALAGSWCPNCHDEAAFLEPMYRDYRARGLEVVSLMFEHFGDFERAAAATMRFRQLYGIDYTTLIAGVSDKDEAAKKLPMLDRVYAFPTLIFIDRKGIVRSIHTGYSGPATGEHYTQFVAEFKHTVDQLLAET